MGDTCVRHGFVLCLSFEIFASNRFGFEPSLFQIGLKSQFI
ncbi:hypothetical protein BN2497_7911 [Janthinobacterium sp. CG23_2]|nr:hypothetical protein BN2497_7911 [Janthinobacterium sp. CG23_2]CUU30353.1 hypothetical protein BN3177_7911 [Janthinobacterium sp. CG23_2]